MLDFSAIADAARATGNPERVRDGVHFMCEYRPMYPAPIASMRDDFNAGCRNYVNAGVLQWLLAILHIA